MSIGGCLGAKTLGKGVWVMKDYGVIELWTKLPIPDNVPWACIGKCLRGNGCPSFSACFPETNGKCGVLYGIDGDCYWLVFLYDKNKEEFEEIVEARWSFPLPRKCCSLQCDTKCLESLVSLKIAELGGKEKMTKLEEDEDEGWEEDEDWEEEEEEEWEEEEEEEEEEW